MGKSASLTLSLGHRYHPNGYFLFHVDWRGTSPLLWAALSVNDFGLVKRVNTEFIVANRPPSHRVYFATGTNLEYEHENMKRRLESFGESFEERVELGKEASVGLFRRRKVREKTERVLASTVDRHVIEAVFDSYISWDSLGWPFAFAISSEEPPGWREQFVQSSPWTEKIRLSTDLIERSHSIVATHFDHGADFVSCKVSRVRVEEIAREIAAKLSVKLSVEDLDE